MDNRNGLSDSNDISNSSSTFCIAAANTESLSSSEPLNPDVPAFRLLSRDLESILDSPDFDFYSDAKIVLSTGHEVSVHRCILSARSPFFKNAFAGKQEGAKFELKELVRDYDVGFDSLVAVLAYLYSGKVRPLPKGVCVCVDDGCSHVACRPAVDFMVEILYVSFTFQVPEMVEIYQRHLLDVLDEVAADDILVVLYVADMCGKGCEKLLARSIEIVAKSDVDTVTLDKALPQHIVKQIMDLRLKLSPDIKNVLNKHVERIHRALDSDDVELVKMLLEEGHTNLDHAHALHYAVAYCYAKTTTKLLDLGRANVNSRNSRGYTVLHVAAMRKEPKIIMSLLTKGARLSDLTRDGRKAVQIAKRLTRAADYFTPTEVGKPSPKDRLCIELLERETIDPLLGEASHSPAMAWDDLKMKLCDLENRVAIAKLLFPMEAEVVMDIAHVDGTLEFTKDGIQANNTACAKMKAPVSIQEEQLNRMKALSRTVELGKRFFPRCSEVLNRFDADDSQLDSVGNDTPQERALKRRRCVQLEKNLSKALDAD